jgi:hypothetical protein
MQIILRQDLSIFGINDGINETLILLKEDNSTKREDWLS